MITYRIIHRCVKYSTGNRVNNIATTMYGATSLLEISGGAHCKVYDSLITMLYT